MKKQLFIWMFFFSTLFYGCTDNSPVSSNSFETSYFPLTPGSRWEYEIDTPNSKTGEQTAISIDSVLYSEVTKKRTFFYISRLRTTDWDAQPSSNNGVYFKSNDTIFHQTDKIYLIERENASWVLGPFGDNVRSTYTFKVIGKGLSHTVKNKTYNDVLRVNELISRIYTDLGDTIITEYDIYYAKNVGLIEKGPMKLKSYSIK